MALSPRRVGYCRVPAVLSWAVADAAQDLVGDLEEQRPLAVERRERGVATRRTPIQGQVPGLVGDPDAAMQLTEPGVGAHAIAVAQRPDMTAARVDHQEAVAAAHQLSRVERAGA